MKLTCILSACLPAVRPTSGRRIGPVFSHNIEYRYANTNLLFQLRFIHSDMMSLSSFLACLSLWLVNEKVRNCWGIIDELYSFYLLHHTNGQMHMCLIVSSVKLITKHIAVVYQFKSARMVSCWNLYVCSWAVICHTAVLSSEYDDRLEDYYVQFTSWTMKYVTFYDWTNRLTSFSTSNLPIQLLHCINKRLTTSIIILSLWTIISAKCLGQPPTHTDSEYFMLHKVLYCVKIK